MKYPFIILALLLVNLKLSAQIERNPSVVGKTDTISFPASNNKQNKEGRRERMKELNLTKEQKGKMKEIMQSGKAGKDAIQNNAQLSDQDKKKQMRELQKEQAQKVQAILTAAQREKFKASKPNDL